MQKVMLRKCFGAGVLASCLTVAVTLVQPFWRRMRAVYGKVVLLPRQMRGTPERRKCVCRLRR